MSRSTVLSLFPFSKRSLVGQSILFCHSCVNDEEENSFDNMDTRTSLKIVGIENFFS
jgi:hypothetical protein